MLTEFVCGPIHDPIVEFPDLGWCCMGVAVRGPDGCTCWEVVYDVAQADLNLFDTAEHREQMCGDCAFRSDSPERQGDDRYRSYEFHPYRPFFCHQGMRRIVYYRHASGVAVPAAVDDRWDPPEIDGRVFKANGLVADVCAGWFSRARTVRPRNENYAQAQDQEKQ